MTYQIIYPETRTLTGHQARVWAANHIVTGEMKGKSADWADDSDDRWQIHYDEMSAQDAVEYLHDAGEITLRATS